MAACGDFALAGGVKPADMVKRSILLADHAPSFMHTRFLLPPSEPLFVVGE